LVQSTNGSESAPSTSQTSNISSTLFSISRIVEEGWGSRANFQASYGLKMTPEGLEEGNAILKAMQEQDTRQ
jgi:hypothetical protein